MLGCCTDRQNSRPPSSPGRPAGPRSGVPVRGAREGEPPGGHDVPRAGVSTSGYYAWRSRPASPRSLADQVLTCTIRTIHRESHGTYGAPRIHAELRDDYRIFCSHKRLARLMAEAGIQGTHRRRRVKTTRPEKTAAPAPDLLERDFGATEPDQKWSRTSPTCRPGRGSSTSRWCWIASAAGRSAGACAMTCPPSSSWMPWRWRSRTAAPAPA